jgi:hypothetical protein
MVPCRMVSNNAFVAEAFASLHRHDRLEKAASWNDVYVDNTRHHNLSFGQHNCITKWELHTP